MFFNKILIFIKADIPNQNNNKRKTNAQKYVYDGIISQIVSKDEGKKSENIDNIPNQANSNESKDYSKSEKEIKALLNPESFDFNIESTKLNLSAKLNNEKENENKFNKIGFYNNENLTANNQSIYYFIRFLNYIF